MFTSLTHRSSHQSIRRGRGAAIGVLALAASLVTGAHGAVRFVNDNAPGGVHNGLSWFTAYTSLQSALAAASAGDQIWVAAGTYKPSAANNRSESFFLVQGVEVYGGFSGTETLLSQRDVVANPTILSGDIGAIGNKADNSFHVVQTVNSISTLARLDGFIITDGNANGGGGDNLGGGMKNSGMPTVRNCVFVGNACVTNGAAVSNGSSVATTSQFQNCVFINNTGLTAVSIQNGPVTLAGCTIANNSGIGLLLLNSSPASVRNSIIYDNGGGNLESNQVLVTNSSASFVFCCIEGLTGSLGGVGNIATSPDLVDINGPDNILGTIDDDARLRGSSSCIDAGSTVILPNDSDDLDGDGDTAETIPFDRDGNDRRVEDLVNNTGAGTSPPVDIGAYEFKRNVRTILVNAAATGADNGTTWADAYVDIQSGLDELADVKFGGAGEIWVAQGTYKPSLPAGRSATFKMVAQVELYGGFTGVEGSRSQRNPFANKTILSGDIGAPGAASDNCFHVVTANGSALFGSPAALDGFIITAGNADGSPSDINGGGVFCQNQTANDPVFRNCMLVNNKAANLGGGAFCNLTDASFINCVFSGNAASTGGGVSTVNAGSPKFINCTIAHNSAGSAVAGGLSGGGAGQSVQVINCILAGNTVQFGGGGGTQPSQINLFGGAVNYSCVEGLTGSLGGTGNIGVLPFFSDPDGADDAFGTPDDDYRLLACSSVIDAANTTALPADADDLDDDGNTAEALSEDAQGLSRVFGDVGVPDSGLGAGGDMGAYEFHGVSGGSCPADCFPVGGNDTVDVDDLFTVINHWGACVGNPCQGDTSPACGDGVVDIDDLFVVINHWGFCP